MLVIVVHARAKSGVKVHALSCLASAATAATTLTLLTSAKTAPLLWTWATPGASSPVESADILPGARSTPESAWITQLKHHFVAATPVKQSLAWDTNDLCVAARIQLCRVGSAVGHFNIRIRKSHNLVLYCCTSILLVTIMMQSALYYIGLPAEAHQ